MPHNILLTGVSGYLGGTLLARFDRTNLTADDKLYALVRKESQADAVRARGTEPLLFDAYDEQSIAQAITCNHIDIVFYLIDCDKFTAQEFWIRALSTVKKDTGREVHFLYVIIT